MFQHEPWSVQDNWGPTLVSSSKPLADMDNAEWEAHYLVESDNRELLEYIARLHNSRLSDAQQAAGQLTLDQGVSVK